MNKQFTVDYFITKFEAIPEELWAVQTWHSYQTGGSCANGHCGIRDSMKPTEESIAFKSIFGLIDPHNENFNASGYSYAALLVNDGRNKKYPQPTPKQRILAALYDIKKMTIEQKDERSVAIGMPKEPEAGKQYPDLTKELAVLPEDKKEIDVVPLLTKRNLITEKI